MKINNVVELLAATRASLAFLSNPPSGGRYWTEKGWACVRVALPQLSNVITHFHKLIDEEGLPISEASAVCHSSDQFVQALSDVVLSIEDASCTATKPYQRLLDAAIRHIGAAIDTFNQGPFVEAKPPSSEPEVPLQIQLDGMTSSFYLQRVFTCQSDKREAAALHNYAGVKIELANLRLQIASAISQGKLPKTFYADLA